MKGCILFGRFVWSNEAKNRPAAAPPVAVDPVRPPPVPPEAPGSRGDGT
jgi:hypothetical protein